MNRVVLFSTKYGSTKRVAKDIARFLDIENNVFDVEKEIPELTNFDDIILGFPVYAGSTTRAFRYFIKKNRDEIINKVSGIFVLCWDDSRLNNYIENIFTSELRSDVYIKCVGGEINPNDLLEVEKSIIFNLTGIEKRTSSIDEKKIKAFAEKLLNR